MRSFYINALENGSPLIVKVTSVAISAALFLIVALPALAVAARIVA